jgi:hypothetical protein
MENKPADIDQYIWSFPEPVQLILEQMRGIVHVALPQAVESISLWDADVLGERSPGDLFRSVEETRFPVRRARTGSGA